MKEIKCYYNYSSFGDSVSIASHGEIYDEIILTIPDEIETYETEIEMAYRVPGGTPYFFEELFGVSRGDVIAGWYDGQEHHEIICDYRLCNTEK